MTVDLGPSFSLVFPELIAGIVSEFFITQLPQFSAADAAGDSLHSGEKTFFSHSKVFDNVPG
jgi:hypothetical protein